MKLSTALVLACAAGAASAFHPGMMSPSASSARTTGVWTRTMSTVEAAAEGDASPPSGDDQAMGARQKLYGVSVDMPNTYVRCGRCSAAYALTPEDLGTKGKGRRVECSVCSHSWFQARDRLFNLNDGFELVDFPENDLNRIAKNIEAGRSPDFVGVAKFYVGNLSYEVTEEELHEAFSEKGEVGDVSIIKDNETGRSRGFAFVTMFTEEDGKKAMELDGAEVRGRNISVRPPNN